MRSASRLYRAHVAIGVVAVAMLVAGAVLVIDGGRVGPFSGAAIAGACVDWFDRGGPASVVGVALATAALAAAILGVRSVARQLFAGRRYLSSLALGEDAVIGGVRCRIVEAPDPQAFCAGYLRPRVHVSRGALTNLSDAELGAVLAHELHHVRRRDPLRRLLARALADALFFLPVLRLMSDRYATLGELAADEAAVAGFQDRRPLASALLKFSEQSAPAAVAGVDAQRVDYLLGDPDVARWRLSRLHVLTSVGVLAGIAVFVALLAHGALDPTVNLPLALAAACMAAMVAVPAALAWAGAVFLLQRIRLRARRA